MIKSTSESQGHGKAIEKSIQKNICNLSEEQCKSYKNTDPHDIRKEHNLLKYELLRDKNISIKATGSNTIYGGKISRFLEDISPNSNTIMIVAKWVQKNDQKKEVIKTYIINLGKIVKFKDELVLLNLKKDVLDFEKYIHNLPNGKISKEYIKKAKELEKKYPDVFDLLKINTKVDSKSQRRVQCSININLINKDNITEFEGAKVYDKEYCGLIYSPPRNRNGVKKEMMKKFAKSNGIDGPGKRGGWPTNMKKEEILSYIINKGYSEDEIKEYQSHD